MAYLRRYARRSRRPLRTTRSTRTRYPRRARRAPFRKSTRMSKRRILNTSSVKKQDNMLALSLDSSGGTPEQRAFDVPGTGALFVWCATARDRGTSSGSDATASSVRERDAVYMRGLKESIIMSTNSAASWRWRRICFTVKGVPLGTGVATETNSGWTRQLWNRAGTAFSGVVASLIFRGTQGVDWQDVFVAKVDTNNIKVCYDRLRTLSSGNQVGKFFRDKRWYPMNKTLVYQNDEAGEGESNEFFSTNGRAGMGDYYIVDYIDCATLNSADTLKFQPEATLYWHER